MRLTRAALGIVTWGLMTLVAGTAQGSTDSARAALFEVTSDASAQWTAGRFHTVAWNVGDSKAATVRISLSTDGGETFPHVLAAASANDGSESVAVPNVQTSRARLKVEAVGNRFYFDISDANFTIVLGPGPSASVGDASVVEGNTGTTPASVPVTLSAASGSPVTVDFTTAPGTATAPADYAIATGTLTFAAGQTVQNVTLSVVGETVVEAHETFFLNISNLSGGGVITDAQGVVTILNDDGASELSIADATTNPEGNTGSTDALHAVTLSVVSGSNVTVDFATADGTATGGTDYGSTTGTLTFAPGTVVRNVTVSITGDLVDEADETYFVNLSNPVGSTILDGQGLGTIIDDDGTPTTPDQTGELSHGFRITEDLAGGSPDVDTFAISQKPFSSYEVVVDATSGDITPVGLDLTDGGTTVIASGVAIGSGTTQSRSLRFRNSTSAPIDTQVVRVQSGDCTTNCDASDTYRLRAYETTSAIPRFNNNSTQVTLIVLQNPTDSTISGNMYFWDASGALLHTEPVSLGAKNVLIFNTATIPALLGVSGAVTVAHDGRHSELVGKGVALEPATGFSFDSPMIPRAR